MKCDGGFCYFSIHNKGMLRLLLWKISIKTFRGGVFCFPIFNHMGCEIKTLDLQTGHEDFQTSIYALEHQGLPITQSLMGLQRADQSEGRGVEEWGTLKTQQLK